MSQLFSQVDVSQNGVIDRREFLEVVGMLGIQLSPEEEQSLFDYLDVDGSDTIEF